jgi:hypothetical protein
MQIVSGSTNLYAASYKFDETTTWTTDKDGVYEFNNLMVNGACELASTYNVNFESATLSGARSGYCFSDTRLTAQVLGTLYIPVVTNETYFLSAWHRSTGSSGDSNLYSGYHCYDRNKVSIWCRDLGGYGNTTLAAQLNNGATSVSLTSAAGWAATGAPSYQRYLNIYPTGDPDYGDAYKYTKLLYEYSNLTSTTLTLAAPYPGVTMPAGTPVSNGQDGSTYNYALAAGGVVPNTWSYYSTVITGEGHTNIDGYTKFRYGTKYITWMSLTNYGNSGTRVILTDDIQLGNITRYGQGYPYNKHMSRLQLGTTKLSDLNEVGYG